MKWKKISQENRNWKDRNKYLRADLREVEYINNLTTGESGLTANNVRNMQSTEKKFQDEIAKKLGKSFNNLAMAATEKSKIIDVMAQSISKITSSNA